MMLSKSFQILFIHCWLRNTTRTRTKFSIWSPSWVWCLHFLTVSLSQSSMNYWRSLSFLFVFFNFLLSQMARRKRSACLGFNYWNFDIDSWWSCQWSLPKFSQRFCAYKRIAKTGRHCIAEIKQGQFARLLRLYLQECVCERLNFLPFFI